MSSGIVSYTKQYQSEAAQAHAAGIKYFLGETNSGENSSCFMSMRFGAWCMCMFILCGVQLPVAAAESVQCVFNHLGRMSRIRSEFSCLQTFGAALWIIDYSLQGALNGVDRLYFHQGTISNCVSVI